MEKLQAAIEKARAQRQAEAPRKRTVEVKPAIDPDLWTSLPRLDLNPKSLIGSRVFLSQSRREAIYYDKLRTKIIQQCRDNGWKRILVTSATAGCGKTTTCTNIAASFVRQSDRRLMLCEMDMRRPSLKTILGTKPRGSFSDVLEEKIGFGEAAYSLSDNVVVAMNAGVHTNPSKLILQDRTPQILDDIEARYAPDLMLFDAPPLLATDDTQAFLKLVDCAIIIAAAEETTSAQVDICEREIAEQTAVMGVVLNKCRYLDETYDYGYGD